MTDAPTALPGPTGLEIATQWAALPPEHLKAALQRLEPELKRAHEARMETLRIAEAAQQRQLALDEKEAHRDFLLRAGGLAAGFVLAGGMLGAAVTAVVQHEPWVASAWGSTGMIGVIGTFIPRFRVAPAGGRPAVGEATASDS
ncbi:hypothetical protein [Streptacidiphilus anmyonensis]|uniref:hypothetical protein n=1 Tax=Streptacidiphilus anmyonensis TaxID=405782 RepID=UPI0005A9B3EA|nr:hypothetical protein [Streptacidiphilus anmyonensis]